MKPQDKFGKEIIMDCRMNPCDYCYKKNCEDHYFNVKNSKYQGKVYAMYKSNKASNEGEKPPEVS